jgi:hypothetical protein
VVRRPSKRGRPCQRAPVAGVPRPSTLACFISLAVPARRSSPSASLTPPGERYFGGPGWQWGWAYLALLAAANRAYRTTYYTILSSSRFTTTVRVPILLLRDRRRHGKWPRSSVRGGGRSLPDVPRSCRHTDALPRLLATRRPSRSPLLERTPINDSGTSVADLHPRRAGVVAAMSRHRR